MKVIFLDIDGVLNYHGSQIIDATCLSNLKNIVENTNAKIILISTWKQFFDEEIFSELSEKDKESFLHHRKLLTDSFEIFDIVEDYFADKDTNVVSEVSLGDLVGMDTDDHDAWRSIEIARWLNKNKDVESFVILDDFNCQYDKYYPTNWIQTWYFGKALRKEDAEKAIEILNAGLV
jgi:hypothetical protein